MKTPYVKELEPNQTISTFFLVQNKEIRQKKTGRRFRHAHDGLASRAGSAELPADRSLAATCEFATQRILDRVRMIYGEIAFGLGKGRELAVASPGFDDALDGNLDRDCHRLGRPVSTFGAPEYPQRRLTTSGDAPDVGKRIPRSKSAWGQTQRLGRAPLTSAVPLKADICLHRNI